MSKLGIDTTTICDTITIICHKPAQPSSLLAAAMGYAVVAVNIRGTGCSGGSYDFFEPLQLLDGYDVIETVAAQPWVRGGKVGMVGLSYPGISQLFVASTQPPHLTAITPLSVYDDTARGVLAPGGIYNKGFALSWAEAVLNEAKPYGQGWEQTVVDGGDTTCADNQKLRAQNVDAVAKAQSAKYYEADIADPVNPALFADKINVPVFMTGAWQDEQTGPRFVNLSGQAHQLAGEAILRIQRRPRRRTEPRDARRMEGVPRLLRRRRADPAARLPDAVRARTGRRHVRRPARLPAGAIARR